MSWTILSEHQSALKKRILLAAGTFLFLWVVFFDSHSVYSRFQMYRQLGQLETENVQLREKITNLELRLTRPPADDEIERIAREDYGMTRPGDRVYPVKENR